MGAKGRWLPARLLVNHSAHRPRIRWVGHFSKRKRPPAQKILCLATLLASKSCCWACCATSPAPFAGGRAARRWLKSANCAHQEPFQDHARSRLSHLPSPWAAHGLFELFRSLSGAQEWGYARLAPAQRPRRVPSRPDRGGRHRHKEGAGCPLSCLQGNSGAKKRSCALPSSLAPQPQAGPPAPRPRALLRR